MNTKTALDDENASAHEPSELAKRIRDLETLVMVLDVTLAVVVALSKPKDLLPFVLSQIEAARAAHMEVMGEESMCPAVKIE